MASGVPTAPRCSPSSRRGGPRTPPTSRSWRSTPGDTLRVHFAEVVALVGAGGWQACLGIESPLPLSWVGNATVGGGQP